MTRSNSDIVWRPSEDAVRAANLTRFMKRHGAASYDDLLRRSIDECEWFWDAAMKDIGAEWYEPYRRVLDDSRGFPWCRWFEGGKLNLVHNCLDRHARNRPDRVALEWESEAGDTRSLTYRELDDAVCRVAESLRGLGLGPGDAAAFYMPMVPELVIAILAVWKIGAVVVPVFSGFGPEALAVRVADCSAKVVFTADAALRRGAALPLKPAVDEALRQTPSVRRVVVLRRYAVDVPWTPGRDVDWATLLEARASSSPTERLDAEDHCLVIYTSGTTGRPKGTVHCHGGLLATVPREQAYFFDLRPDDRFFWLTDIGWMMGAWEIIGVLFQGATLCLYEGAPNWPDAGRLWRLVERQRMTHLGVSPTAVRMLMRAGGGSPDRHDLTSLRVLGSTGEPWDPESYVWYFEQAGGRRCPVINISGGTELMGCLLVSLPIGDLRPCGFSGPGLGMDVDVVDAACRPVRGEVGYLICRKPSPSMTRGFLNDPERYLETYFARWPGVWYHGDWASIDREGFWFIHGRADDTIKVAGKRIGPAEVESALVAHAAVSEAAAFGVPDPLKGEGLVCIVVLRSNATPSKELEEEVAGEVVRRLGKTLRPSRIVFAAALPKTRSGKIVRGAIRRRYLGEPVGDISSVENPEALEALPRASAG